MIFTLEALDAKYGDSLLLHYGSQDPPQLILVDGGPRGVYNHSLKPCLNRIKEKSAGDDPLDIRLCMVSHIDDDHIQGILELAQELVNLQQQHRPKPYDINTIWHNSFDDIIGNQPDQLSTILETSVGGVIENRVAPSNLSMSLAGSLMMASVNQGRKLRDSARVLNVMINRPPKKLIISEQNDEDEERIDEDLILEIIGPEKNRVIDLQEEWDKKLEKLADEDDSIKRAIAAAFVDKSVYNLSSIIVLAKCGDKKMLLTGDARGDDIINGLKAKRLLEGDKFHIDLLKLPHHGSDHNVSTDFFRQITADRYVVSGDGKYGNPELATLKMLSEARGQDEYVIYLTNREQRLVDYFEAEKSAGKKYEAQFREDADLSIIIDLDEELEL